MVLCGVVAWMVRVSIVEPETGWHLGGEERDLFFVSLGEGMVLGLNLEHSH